MEADQKKSKKPNLRENAFPLSAATFWYTIPTFIDGFKRDLDVGDLTEALTEHKSSRLGDQMERYWNAEVERALKKGSKPSLGRVMVRMFGLEFMFYGIIYAIVEAVRVIQPIFLGLLLQYYIPGQEDITLEQAYWYAGGVVLCSFVTVVLVHPYMMGILHLGMKMRVACCSLIYRKALRLSKTALGQTTAGQVVNLLSNDVNRFDVAVIFAHLFWLGPLETIVVIYIVYQQVQIAAIVGVLLIIVFIPLQFILGKGASVYRLKTALRTDERVRLMNEIISGIQVIKMYAWEKPFAQLVDMARRHEIKTIRIASYMRGILLSLNLYSTRLSIFGSILVYVLLGNDITAVKVFVVTSFYNVLRQSMTVFFPSAISQVAEALISISRLNKFMLYDETQLANEFRQSEINKKIKSKEKEATGLMTGKEPIINGEATKEIGIFMQHATAKWTEASTDNTLTDINLTVLPGKLLAVIGPVGSGKSSLLHVILQELPLISGTLKVNGEISYASQEPWLFAGTVRQNILFGLPMDKARYKMVVKKCSLERDFNLLPYGDKTIVGDRGVSLSGGQRARINLARAVYKEADIYLLDDPLSAVDTHVGKELFENCICGFLKHKVVVLVTHQLQYLQEVDHILYLDDGVAKAQGTFKELQECGLDFTKMLSNVENEEDLNKSEQKELHRQGSIKSVASVEVEAPEFEEQKSSGSVGFYVYRAYFSAGGNCFVISMMFMLFIIAQLFTSAADYFITLWVNQEQEDALAHNNTEHILERIPRYIHHHRHRVFITIEESDNRKWWDFTRDEYIYIYSAIIILLVVFTTIRAFVFFAVCMRASTNLHNTMFQSISRATMKFFNTNSAGRILNRFSKDMGAIDELLTTALIDSLQIGLQLIGIIAVVAAVNPLLMVPTAVAGLIFYLLRVFYLRTSRSVKRLEGTTRSPVFSHLSATLQGLTTIRAFRAEEVLIKEFDNHQDLHSSAWYIFLSTSRAFGYWLDLVCIIYIASVTFSFLLLGNEHFGGNVGLAITQAIGVTGMFQWGMRQSTELENQMTSVERVLEYTNIEHEPPLESEPSKKPPPSWPEKGEIIFQNVFLRYFPDDPPVLKNLSFHVQPKEKIGIVGRTGAGKSSLINALFQLTETEGKILIDGVNIKEIGLHDLRSKISIIPQEPVLFSGTMRKNLDPFDEYSDSDLWRALEDVELKEAVEDLMFGLNSQMSEGGSNFSVGQRQLVCLARAILRNNRILVLDEATANVDPQTDRLIQATIREKFSECTVLTIAHRLNTVMDSDKILVMDAGTMREYDHPYVLLENTDGILFSMVQQTGKAMAENLHKIAKAAYYESKH